MGISEEIGVTRIELVPEMETRGISQLLSPCDFPSILIHIIEKDNHRGGVMATHYYDKADLVDFPNIGEHAPEQGQKFFEYYGSSISAGKLSEREKTLVALAVALTQNCPYCIDAYTTKSLSLGITEGEMMETAHVGAAMMAGVTLAHSTQMRKIIKKKQI
jgi:alkylhydroperoxidase/carboxymuconolactone decarboxylase family protein